MSLPVQFSKYYARIKNVEVVDYADFVRKIDEKMPPSIRDNRDKFMKYLEKKSVGDDSPVLRCIGEKSKNMFADEVNPFDVPEDVLTSVAAENARSREEMSLANEAREEQLIETRARPSAQLDAWGELKLWLNARFVNDKLLPEDCNRVQQISGIFEGASGTPKYHIKKSDYPEFLRLFADTVKSGVHPPLMEYRHSERVYPVVADFDFRQATPERLFNDAFVVNVRTKLGHSIRKFVELESPPQGVILTKPVRSDTDNFGQIKPGCFKDGFHLHFPDVVVSKRVARMIYEDFIENVPRDEYVPQGVTNEKVYDSASYTNAWFLLGAKKPGEPEPWTCDETPARMSLADRPESKYTTVVKEIKEEPVSEGGNQLFQLSHFKELLRIIGTRAVDYEEWFESLCAIYNVSVANGFDASALAHEFSKLADNYNARSVDEKLVEVARYSGAKKLTLGSVIKWAKEENYALAKEVVHRNWNTLNKYSEPMVNDALYAENADTFAPEDTPDDAPLLDEACLDLYDGLSSVSTPEIKHMKIIHFDLEKMSEVTKNNDQSEPWLPEYDRVFPLLGENLLKIPENKDDMFGICLQKYFTDDSNVCRIRTIDDDAYEFNGVILRKASDTLFKKVVSTVFIPMLRSRRAFLIGEKAPNEVIKTYTAAIAYLGANARVKSGIESFKSRVGVCQEDLSDLLNGNIKNNRALELYAFKNGVYDIRSGELREGRVDDYITMWNPYEMAEPDAEKQKEIYDFFRAPLASDEEVESILDFYAMSFLGGQGHSIQKKFSCAFLYGTKGHNGKSVAGDMMLNSHGEDEDNYGLCLSNKMTVLSNEKDDPDAHSGTLLNFMGKRFVYGEEPGEGRKYSTSLIKSMFNGIDYKMTARRAFSRDATKFRPQFRLMVSQNSAPTFDCPDSATMNRVTIYGYNKTFSATPGPGELQEDDKLIVKMKTKEYTQQLVLMGLKRCREMLILDERAPCIPESVKMNTVSVFDDQDDVKMLLNEHVEFTNNVTDYIKITNLLPLFTEHKSSAYLKKALIRIIGPVTPNAPKDAGLLGKLVMYANAPHIKGARLRQLNEDVCLT
jgi:hypothetical protein